MARLSDDEIERLKGEVSLERLAESRGVALKRHGADLLGLCPFHSDREPSLVISPAKNLWHCLGACQAGGSVIDWVMKAEGVSFRHAVELLRADLPALAAGAAAGAVKRSTVRKLPPPVDMNADDQALLGQVVEFYHATLKQSPEALAYLESRGLHHPEAIERFKLGYANRTLGYRLPARTRAAGAEIRGRLEKLGVLRESGHEHLSGSLVVPILDEQGTVQGLYGRKLLDDLPARCVRHLYLPGPHRGVWNVEALQACKEVILCEALLDALTFWCAGFRNVTASYGVEGFTDDHLAAFRKYGTERVLIAYDRDQAGEQAAEALAKQLTAVRIACYRLHFPHGMDANEYALKVTPASKSLEVLIRKAGWLGSGRRPAAAPDQDDAGEVRETAAEPVPSLAAEPQASPEPAAPPPELAAEVKGEDVLFKQGDRRWRVRGLAKNLSFEVLKVNVLVGRGDAFHVDTLDLYSARQRATYVGQAAAELGVKEDVIKKDLGRVLLKLEALQEEQIRQALEPKQKAVTLTDEEQAAALDLLKDPRLLDRILSDFARCGVVGEETNKLTGYLAAVSRKLDEPLAVIVQSASAAGKSSLMEAILALMPEEERVKYSAMTGQSLFYMGEADLKHKILAIVEEEGAHRASYALKLLQSEGELTIASTGKDATTGRLVTHEYHVAGPVMIFLTTTAIEIDEELLNRCLVLTVDEDRAQTQAIHKLQREKQTLAGLLAQQDRQQILSVHRNAQRLLRPLWVVNPYAHELTFLDDRTRTRRDHVKYLTLIRTIALLHQHQRPVKSVMHQGKRVEYLEATLADIATANRLAHEVLGRSLDELPPQTRRLLVLLDQMVSEACKRLEMERSDYRFSRRDVRQFTGWGDTQLRLHLERLAELEYVLVHRGGRGQSFVYELLYDGLGKDGQPFLPGLLDVAALAGDATTTESWRGSEGRLRGEETELAGPLRGQNAPKAGGVRGGSTSPKPATVAHLSDRKGETAQNSLLWEELPLPLSYVAAGRNGGAR